MSSSKNPRLSPAENEISPKKPCLDMQFHDDSSLSTFTWHEDSSGSSAWHVVYDTGKSIYKPEEVNNAPVSILKPFGSITQSQETITPRSFTSDNLFCITRANGLASESNTLSITPFNSEGSKTPINDNSLNSDLCLSDLASCSNLSFRNNDSNEVSNPSMGKHQLKGTENNSEGDKHGINYKARSDRQSQKNEDYVRNQLASKRVSVNDISGKPIILCSGVSPLHKGKTADRESFVMRIMKTFKSNSLYDSFCYTLPRSTEAVQSFYGVLNNILSLADQCRFGLIYSHHKNFPNSDSMELAEGIVHDMRERYSQVLENMSETRNRSSKNDKILHEALEKEVDNDLPNSLVFYISDVFVDIVPSWCGQFQVCVNPVTNVLSVRMFEFRPSYPSYTLPAFSSKQITEELCREIFKQMEYFECSRQFRMDIDLQGIYGMTYFEISNTTEGLLFLKINSPATFFQRFVNCSASDRNEWNRRESFLPFQDRHFRNYVLVLGGVVSELSNIAAQIVVACPAVRFMDIKVTDIVLDQHLSNNHKGLNEHTLEKNNVGALTINTYNKPSNTVRISTERRTNVIEILYKYKLISKEQCKEMKEFINVHGPRFAKGSECNFLDSDEWHPCFNDFINYHCLDVSELEHQLTRRCNLLEKSTDTGIPYFYPDIQNMTVAQYLITENVNKPYYSFCTADIANKNMWHCTVCGVCNSENEWHCPMCDKCSKVQTVCEYCGHGELGYIIEPRSVMKGIPTKSGWDVNLSKTDVPDWSTDTMHITKNTSFHIHDFKRDELGLIDPMAFLLGSEARGGGNRQGRSLQKYEKKVEGNPKMLAAAGCILQ